jgi:3-deoxy-7-phosphoheptulonate synthase
MNTVIVLHDDANPDQVCAALQALGLWTHHLTGKRARVITVASCSRQVPRQALLAIDGVRDVCRQDTAHPEVDGQRVPLQVGPLTFGGDTPPVLVAGPCSVESEPLIHTTAAVVAAAGGSMLRGGAFKPRTSPYAFDGHGPQALTWMREAADAHGLQVVTEVLSERDVDAVAEHADMLQIGSRNGQNYALLRAVGAAGMPVLLKRPMSATVEEWLLAGEHLLVAGASGVLFCERGIVGFDPQTRNLLDLSAVALLSHVHHQPVIVDPSHATGRRDLVRPLAAAAVAAGAAGVMVETHPEARAALSDGAQALSPEELREVSIAIGIGPLRRSPANPIQAGEASHG